MESSLINFRSLQLIQTVLTSQQRNMKEAGGANNDRSGRLGLLNDASSISILPSAQLSSAGQDKIFQLRIRAETVSVMTQG